MQKNSHKSNSIIQALSSLSPKSTFGIYIHVPFCQKKCGYCDFYSITDFSSENNFINALLKEIKFYAENIPVKLQVDSIFIGGGTPSILKIENLHKITSTLHNLFTISPNAEWTIEANPGTVDSRKLISYKMQGINRISLGVQSFSPEELEFLGRIHSAAEAEESINLAKKIGFSNISLDLMCAFPGQTINSFRSSLKKALSLDINHLSCYTLIPEENTSFYDKYQKGELQFLDENSELEFYYFTADFLEKNNFTRYEVSNYYRNGEKPCIHNLKYWNLEPYLGFGPSAHSYISPYRFSNVKDLKQYINDWAQNKPPVSLFEKLTTETEIFEYIFLKLRMVKGIPLVEFHEKFKKDFNDIYRNKIEKLINNDMAEINNEHFRLTEKGFALADEIASEF